MVGRRVLAEPPRLAVGENSTIVDAPISGGGPRTCRRRFESELRAEAGL
jgi:hypothetical protein